MPTVNIYNQEAKKLKTLSLNDGVFTVAINEDLVHQAMVTQMSNERQVLAHTKDRSEVRGGGRKPHKQKGTGRARAGSRRSPIWIGGGVTFGPLKNKNFSKNINLKMKRKALLMVVGDRMTTNNLVVLDKIEISEFKTKDFVKVTEALRKEIFKAEGKEKNSILFIVKKAGEKLIYSSKNVPGIKLINVDNINILDLLKFKNLVMTEEVALGIEKKYGSSPKK